MTDQFSAILSACSQPVALFVDFDGTLVEIAARPDAIVVPDTLTTRLAALERSLDGALAIISGRTLADIDGHLDGYPFTVSASHGAEQRHRGDVRMAGADRAASAAAIGKTLQSLLGDDARILVERKPAGVAVHFRAAPERADDVRAAMNRVLGAFDDFHAMEGKMVIEARPRGTDKGKAIAALMQEAPFKGRMPLFIGDDVTDEDGFDAVNAMDGITIKVGAGDTRARFRLPDVSSVHHLLAMLADDTTSRKATT